MSLLNQILLEYTNGISAKMDASVVIITRNRPELLSRAIDKIITQDYPKDKFELIIVDDGGEKDLSLVIEAKKKKFKNINLFWQDSNGLAAGRNLAAKKAVSSIVIFTDDDCEPQKQWLSEIINSFANKEVVGVEGKIVPYGEKKFFTNAPENLIGNNFIGANSAYRTKIIRELKYFEPLNIYKDDSEFAFRAMKRGKIVFAENAVVKHEWRSYSPLRFFDNWFRLKNDWLTLLRHPKEYFKYIGQSLFTNLLKSIFIFAILFFVSNPSSEFFIPFVFVFFLFLVYNLLKLKANMNSFFEFLKFCSIVGFYYLGYPLFFTIGFFQGTLMFLRGKK